MSAQTTVDPCKLWSRRRDLEDGTRATDPGSFRRRRPFPPRARGRSFDPRRRPTPEAGRARRRSGYGNARKSSASSSRSDSARKPGRPSIISTDALSRLSGPHKRILNLRRVANRALGEGQRAVGHMAFPAILQENRDAVDPVARWRRFADRKLRGEE